MRNLEQFIDSLSDAQIRHAVRDSQAAAVYAGLLIALCKTHGRDPVEIVQRILDKARTAGDPP